MPNQSVREWLGENCPTYVGRVTVDPIEKRAERRIVEANKGLGVEVPAHSYKRYGYGLSHIVAQKFAFAVGALDLGFSARLTNCGMSAISMALSVIGERCIDFASRVLYPETKNLFPQGNPVYWADDNEGLAFFLSSGRHSVFLEPIGNGLGMPVFEIESVFREAWEKDVIVVLDNTLLTCSLLNPFEIYNKIREEKGDPKMQLIYVESLSKHYRAGDDDLVTAGIIVVPNNLIQRVDEAIMRNGAYLQFPCLQELPFDLFTACSKIMPQLSRNAKVAAEFLTRHNRAKEVSYPDLQSGAGGVLYFVVEDNDIENVISHMTAVFGFHKGSFGHPHTTWLPFGKLLEDVPKGLIRLAVGSEDDPADVGGKLKRALG